MERRNCAGAAMKFPGPLWLCRLSNSLATLKRLRATQRGSFPFPFFLFFPINGAGRCQSHVLCYRP
jgi:hypothetical protein